MAMALHCIHTPWNVVGAGAMVMDGLVLFPGTFSNNSNVHCDSDLRDLPHQSHILPTECPCVHESDCSVHCMTKCTLAHVHCE